MENILKYPTVKNSEELIEQIHDWHQVELEVDQAGMLVKNVALTGCQSKNGYRYTEEALQQAVPLYDQKPVFLDHPKPGSRPQDRSTRDYVGMIVNPRYEQQRIRGDIRVVKTVSGETFLALAESQAPGIGMSHVVLAYRNSDRTIVEKIEDVLSVDAVVYPATTNNLKEQQVTTNSVPGTFGIAQAEQEMSLYWEQLAKELTEKLEALQSHILQQEQVSQMLVESQLPAYAVTTVFKEQLKEAGTKSQKLKLLQDRKQLLRLAATKNPASEKRAHGQQETNEDAAFIQAVTKH